jgi:hypothetical protein
MHMNKMDSGKVEANFIALPLGLVSPTMRITSLAKHLKNVHCWMPHNRS